MKFNYIHFSIYIYNKSRATMAKAVFNKKETQFHCKLNLKNQRNARFGAELYTVPKLRVFGK